MGPIEADLRQELAYELSGIEGIHETWLDALDKQDIGVLEANPPDAIAATKLQWAVLHFCREATFRLAREVDELRATGAEGDDLG